MFTGIISDIGTITALEQRGDLRVIITTRYDLTTVALGASIACSGVCLTVVDKGPDWFAVDISGETIARTAPEQWRLDNRLNLERAMKLGDELGGHIVTGHVDGIGTVTSLEGAGDSCRVTLHTDAALAPFIAAKGSITLDGISLTVNDVTDHDDRSVSFTVNIIPHTAAVTSFGSLSVDQAVNIEIDVLARYLGRMRSVLENNHTM